MQTVHFILQGKGGVGKSFVAINLAQYLMGLERPLYLGDTDPTNATFASYNALGAEHINISDANMKVDKSKFDLLIERIMAAEGDCVVDTGASSFLPMMDFLKADQVIEFLQESGRRVVIHAPLVGGQAMIETIRGLQSILDFKTAHVVVWENEFFGPVVMDGQRFAQSKLYKEGKDRILGIVRLAQRDPDTVGKAVAEMTTKRLTFDEAINSAETMIMPRQRLTIVRRETFSQLDAIGL